MIYNGCFSHMNKTLQKESFFSQGSNGAAKMNSYLNITLYSLISPPYIKYGNKINTQ